LPWQYLYFLPEPQGQGALRETPVQLPGSLRSRAPRRGASCQPALGPGGAPAPTYEDLLKNANDERLFDYYFTAQLALVDVAWRLSAYNTEAVTPVGIAALSVVIGLLVSVGATFGGSLVYDYGFNVETAGDHPVWHKSDTDVFPAQHD